jgi:hypothetical protein
VLTETAENVENEKDKTERSKKDGAVSPSLRLAGFFEEPNRRQLGY